MTLLRDLQTTARLLRSAAIQRHRLDAQKARTDMRDWAKARRERTRHLIELGGLVQKAGLVELLDDDRATLLGAFLHLADQLRGAEDAGEAESRPDRGHSIGVDGVRSLSRSLLPGGRTDCTGPWR